MNAAFNKIYSELYDVLYSDKPYEKEATFYKQLLLDAGLILDNKRILSLGCGTLNHEIFLIKDMCKVHGVDISEHMIERAILKIKALNLQEKITVECSDMLSFNSTTTFDAALSMFNVLGFCKNLDEVGQLFSKIYASLNSGGVFVFDFWNKEAVNIDPPQNRWKRIVKGDIEVIRLTDPIQETDNDVIKLIFDLIMFKKDTYVGRGTEIQNVHYWNVSDLENLLKKAGFTIHRSCQFFKIDVSPDKHVWSAVLVAKKY